MPWWHILRILAPNWSSSPFGRVGQASTVRTFVIISFFCGLIYPSAPSGILKYATTLLHLNLRCQHISTVLPLLSALPSSRLRTLAIELDVRLAEGRVDSDVNLARVPYALIDAALAHPRFYALERLSLTTYSVERETRSLLSRKAKALMPLAKARGILHRYRR
jgi:hypothetical protein